jgi:hypothetical protein
VDYGAKSSAVSPTPNRTFLFIVVYEEISFFYFLSNFAAFVEKSCFNQSDDTSRFLL